MESYRRGWSLLLLALTLIVPAIEASWEQCGPDDAFDVHNVLVDPSVPRVVYATGNTSAREGSQATWRSTDGGRSWTRVELGGDARLIAVHPARPGTLFAISPRRLLRSPDRGTSWAEIGVVPDPASPLTIFALAIDPAAPRTMYAATGHQGSKPVGGVWRSEDAGATWARAGLSGSLVYDVVLAPGDGRTLYATGSRGLSRSADGGYSWADVGPDGVEARHMAVAVDRGEPQRMFVATAGEGVFATGDGGVSWAAANEGLTSPAVYAIEIDPSHPHVVWAGTSGGGMFRSVDGGASWHDANDGLAARYTKSIAIAPGRPPTVYVSAGRAGLLRWVND